MKRLKKKFLAVLVTMITVIAMMVPVSVSAADTYTVTITANDTGTHTYSVYQIFSGTLSSDGVTLSDVEWGSAVTSVNNGAATLIAALKADSTLSSIMANVKTAADVSDALDAYDNNSAVVKAFAAVVKTFLTENSVTATQTATGSGTVSFSGLSAGYYLILDSLDSGTGAESATMVQVIGNVAIQSKSDLPTVTKEAGEETAEIGDTIFYTITGTLSSNFATYLTAQTAYSYTLTDTMDSCLDLEYTPSTSNEKQVKGGVTVELDGVDVTSYFTIEYENHVLTLTCTDITQIPNISADSVFTITYNATVNSSLTGGNIKNTVQLVTTEATTPEIEETVYTFALDITKIDGDTNEVLEGATFVLKNAAGQYLQVDASNKVYKWVYDEEDASPLTTDATGKIAVYGLDEGTYYLEETVAPTGYNALENDLTIVISATVNQSTGKLESYTISVDGGYAASGAQDANGNYVLSMEVENNQGATLPSTGGIGTTLLYVCGSILGLAIVILLITKIRMKVED
ncbi:MAG: isopeptide-forming domain-containing fimbrial protein [Lachnospiraceae bacterium]|nr:isopeptide-forming domain-containing fimbrial protein [Lachnospiraceae bacterium]